MRRGGLAGVFVVSEGRARLRWIAVGEPEDGTVEVRAGLRDGERVVTDRSGLVDGAAGAGGMTMRVGLAGRLAQAFLGSKLTPLFIAASLGLGALALLATPREEEPQIRVPMVDVAVAWPGADGGGGEPDPRPAGEGDVGPLARRARLRHRAPGPGPRHRPVPRQRAERGEPGEGLRAAVRARRQLPPGARPPSVELHSIDDVPFLALTLWSPTLDSDALRPIAQELAQELSELPDTTKATVIGGEPRVVRVEPSPDRMAGKGVTWVALTGALQSGGARMEAGTSVRGNREVRLEAGPLLRSAMDVGRVIVGVQAGRPVYVRDVARVVDGPDETTSFVSFSPAERAARPRMPPPGCGIPP